MAATEMSDLPRERQVGGARGFVRAARAAAWLEYRTLRYYPSNLLLAAIQELTNVGVWFFVGRFLSTGADAAVSQYGGNYLAYVMIGVLLNQVGMTALTSPFEVISLAFWDKRLETYRLSVHGIWANIIGRLTWQVTFSAFLQMLALGALLASGSIVIHTGVSIPLVALTFLCFVAANAGLGIAGASLFFLLEVKSGQDPITWLYRYLVMLVSGLYVPLALLPGWLRAVGTVLPQTYGFAAMRSLVLTGAPLASAAVAPNLLGLGLGMVVTTCGGGALLALALNRAERRGGIGVVV